MTCREYAKLRGFEVIGKLKRMKNIHYGMTGKQNYNYWIDEAGNEYQIDNKADMFCIVTKEGWVI